VTTPYCLVDYLKMQPGTILTGLVRVEDPGSWRLGKEWHVPEPMNSWKSVKVTSFLEHRVRWRQHLRRFSRDIKNNRIYLPTTNIVEMSQEEKRILLLNFEIGSLIGMFLGHIIRYNGITLANVLTCDGYDVWLS
jgi:hypothetical protein